MFDPHETHHAESPSSLASGLPNSSAAPPVSWLCPCAAAGWRESAPRFHRHPSRVFPLGLSTPSAHAGQAVLLEPRAGSKRRRLSVSFWGPWPPRQHFFSLVPAPALVSPPSCQSALWDPCVSHVAFSHTPSRHDHLSSSILVQVPEGTWIGPAGLWQPAVGQGQPVHKLPAGQVFTTLDPVGGTRGDC